MPRKPRHKSQRMSSEDQKKADEIANGAEVKTNDALDSKPPGAPDKSEELEPYTVSLYAEYKTFIRAIAYQERITQREVIEKAIHGFYEDDEQLHQAARTFKRQQ